MSTSDQWVCPDCNRVTEVIGSERDAEHALAAVMERHERLHRAARRR